MAGSPEPGVWTLPRLKAIAGDHANPFVLLELDPASELDGFLAFLSNLKQSIGHRVLVAVVDEGGPYR
jgi:hypothetical protein